MGKQNAQIIGSVRVGQTTFKAGQEEELAAAASPQEIEHLTKKGAITGEFSKGSKSTAPVAPPVETPAEVEEVVETEVPAEEVPETKAPTKKGGKAKK